MGDGEKHRMGLLHDQSLQARSAVTRRVEMLLISLIVIAAVLVLRPRGLFGGAAA